MEPIRNLEDLLAESGSFSFRMMRPDISKEELVAEYDNWAKADFSYDAFAATTNGGWQQMATDKVAEVLGETKHARILDIGAGTGSVGHRLQQLGFTNIDALEPSEGMFDEARKKNVYKKHYAYFLDNKPVDIPSDLYDLVFLSGAFCTGHIPTVAIKEMIRITKPGGFWVNVMREGYLTKSADLRELEPHMQQLEEEGLWKRISRSVQDGYHEGVAGLIHVYRVV